MVEIVRASYELSKHVNISLSECMALPIFESEAMINMLVNDMKAESEVLKH